MHHFNLIINPILNIDLIIHPHLILHQIIHPRFILKFTQLHLLNNLILQFRHLNHHLGRFLHQYNPIHLFFIIVNILHIQQVFHLIKLIFSNKIKNLPTFITSHLQLFI